MKSDWSDTTAFSHDNDNDNSSKQLKNLLNLQVYFISSIVKKQKKPYKVNNARLSRKAKYKSFENLIIINLPIVFFDWL